MARLITLVLMCFAISSIHANQAGDIPSFPKGEGQILFNFSFAINEYYAKEGRLPSSLEEIRDITDLTISAEDRPGLKPFTQRYALLKEPIEVPQVGRVAMVSIGTYISGKFTGPDSEVRAYASIREAGGIGGSGVVPKSMIDPYLESFSVVLSPIGGSIPAPSWKRPQSRATEPAEYAQKVFTAVKDGEILVPPRSDGEVWRDQKAPGPNAGIPPPPTAPTQPTKQPASSVWWIVGLIILAAGVVFVTRKKKPKA